MIPVKYIKGTSESVDVWYFHSQYQPTLAKRGPIPKGQHRHNWGRWRMMIRPNVTTWGSYNRYFVRDCVRGNTIKHREVWNTPHGREVRIMGSGVVNYKMED